VRSRSSNRRKAISLEGPAEERRAEDQCFNMLAAGNVPPAQKGTVVFIS